MTHRNKMYDVVMEVLVSDNKSKSYSHIVYKPYVQGTAAFQTRFNYINEHLFKSNTTSRLSEYLLCRCQRIETSYHLGMWRLFSVPWTYCMYLTYPSKHPYMPRMPEVCHFYAFAYCPAKTCWQEMLECNPLLLQYHQLKEMANIT